MQTPKTNLYKPLMPTATALWLIENTSLTFEQIAIFCGLDVGEINGMANDDVGNGIMPVNPITGGQLTKAEIARCENDPKAILSISDRAKTYAEAQHQKKVTKYTPIARRQDKPDAIYWLVKSYPEVSDNKIAKFFGTTKATVTSIRMKTHWNITNMRPRDPVLLGLCTQTQLNSLVSSIPKAEKNNDFNIHFDS